MPHAGNDHFAWILGPNAYFCLIKFPPRRIFHCGGVGVEHNRIYPICAPDLRGANANRWTTRKVSLPDLPAWLLRRPGVLFLLLVFSLLTGKWKRVVVFGHKSQGGVMDAGLIELWWMDVVAFAGEQRSMLYSWPTVLLYRISRLIDWLIVLILPFFLIIIQFPIVLSSHCDFSLLEHKRFRGYPG